MEWQIILVLVLLAPLMLFPAAFIWYVNIGGFYKELKAWHAKRAATREKATTKVTETGLRIHAAHKA
jgi:hypothetical protein